MQITDECFVGVAFVAAELVIEMGDHQGSRRFHQQRMQKGHAVGAAGDGYNSRTLGLMRRRHSPGIGAPRFSGKSPSVSCGNCTTANRHQSCINSRTFARNVGRPHKRLAN